MGYVDEHDKEFVIAKGRGRPKGARGALKKIKNVHNRDIICLIKKLICLF